MSNSALIIFGILILLAVGFLVYVMKKIGNRKLSASASQRIRSMLASADRAGDPVLRVIEYDKVLDQMLLELGFQGSTGKKLMKGGARFKNKNALWEGHKLRNIIAHQHGAAASASDADSFRNAVQQAFSQVSS